MTSTQVIYLSFVPLTKRIARDWFIDYLIDQGMAVEFWDITYLLRGKVVENFPHDAAYVRHISSMESLETEIESHRKAVFVILVSKIWAYRKIFRSLTRHECRVVAIEWASMPHIPTFGRKIIFNPVKLFKKLRNKFHSVLLNRQWYIKYYDIVFAAGEVMLRKSGGASRKISIALCDYEQYDLASKIEGRFFAEKYAVFNDIYLPFHSDITSNGMKCINSDVYFSEINEFFSLIEEKYGIDIIVAAHPKAKYGGNEFNGREIIHEMTPYLVKNAEFCIYHFSTSISYAILENKPSLFIYTDSMEHLYGSEFMPYIRAASSYLDAPLINISDPDEISKLEMPNVNLDRYQRYKNDFIVTPGIDAGQSKNIFMQEIIELINKS